MNYNQYKKFHYLLELEKGLEKVVSKNIKNIIFGYVGHDNSILYLDGRDSKCRIKLGKDILKFDMYNKKLEKWSSGDIYFSFNFTTPTNVGIGTGMPDIGVTGVTGVTGANIANIVIDEANIGIGTTMHNTIVPANPLN
ncbi:MAG: hypothetical protein CMH81_08620 [Nitrospiraceae bacterium]|nr:hypothetical protein [Nitrospiraceae bacterium]|tara:strand:+ start:389 stop:805 length:417 start_codon:yes stop_codon:yes gene_type:complete